MYAPPNAAPWDDAVTMALNYAGVKFDKVWDREVIEGGLKEYDWLHLHHEDFTGQYSKFVLNYAGSAWLTEMIERNRSMARTLGFASVPAEKRAVARTIANFVDGGRFLFAMCTATETLDLALASEGVDIAAAFADDSPMDPDAASRMQWTARWPSRAPGWSRARPWRCSPTSTDIRSTRRSAASRSGRSPCSTSAPRSIPSPQCSCRTTGR